MALASVAAPPNVATPYVKTTIRVSCSNAGESTVIARRTSCSHGDFDPLARKLARRYAHTSEPFEDLLQVASLGLLKALERFDPDRQTAFVAFAVPTILGELRR